MRTTIIGGLLVSLLSLGLLAGVPASAAGFQCSIQTPSKVVINKPFQRVTGTLSSDCSENNVDWAAWDVTHTTQGFSNIFLFEATSTDTIDVYDWEDPGTYLVEPAGAYDMDSNEIPQNSRSFTMKYGSRASLATSRSGSYVTLKPYASRYSPSTETFRPWSNRTVLIQKRCVTCTTWQNLKTITLNSAGTATYRFQLSTVRYYRVLAGETATTWGAGSPAVKR